MNSADKININIDDNIFQSTTVASPLLSRSAPFILWILFAVSSGLLIFYQIEKPVWEYRDIFRINGFTLLIWTTVLFFSALLSSYSKNYLSGFKYQLSFTYLTQAFVISVMIFVMSNHFLPFLVSWFGMSFFMSKLIGVNLDWEEAKEATRYTQKFFFSGGVLLSLGVLLLAIKAEVFTLSGVIDNIEKIPFYIQLISALLIIAAAIIQSAIYPFHRWLLSAMTAPSPASALMHAGFVNAAGILLTLFSVLLIFSETLIIIFIIGGLTAIVAQFAKLLQVNVKQKLACSTIAQMGFMIMQCGLGFFNAAVAHLILHGFYKAYLFLSTGDEIQRNSPHGPPRIKIKPLQAVAVLVFGTLGAFLFTYLTGKTSFADSSIFLTLVVAITVGQATYNIVKESSLSGIQKIISSSLLFILGIGVYAVFYNMVTALMFELPMVKVPQSLSALQIFFGVVFLVGFFLMKLGYYRNIPWLYVKLLNLSQPHKNTMFLFKKVKK